MLNKHSKSDTQKLTIIWWILKITYGLYWGIIGIDKFFGYVTESENRVGQATLAITPVNLQRLLQIVGVLEIFIAFLILTKWPRIGSYAGVVLMALIVINLIAMGKHYDIAIHGTVIGIGMIAFIALTEILESKYH